MQTFAPIFNSIKGKPDCLFMVNLYFCPHIHVKNNHFYELIEEQLFS